MIQRKSKKAVTAVVATALLIVVAVVSVIGFQSWFGSFSSKTFVNVEQNSDQTDSSSQIETLVGDELYFKNNLEENLSIKEIKVNGKVCNISISNLSLGVESISLENCTDNLTTNIADVTIVTDNQIFNKKVFLKNVEVVKNEFTTSFTCANITNGLIGLWSMDGNWEDSSGNNYDGTPSSGTSFNINGAINQSGNFMGSPQRIDVSHNVFSVDQSTTICAWVNASTPDDDTIFYSDDGETSFVIYDNKVYMAVKLTDNNWHGLIGTMTLNVNKWNFICGVYEKGIELRTYVNGVLDKNKTIPNFNLNDAGNCYGISYTCRSGGRYYEGSIDELAIYNRALNSSEIQEIYQAGTQEKTICNP